ncbi:glycosyltransferase family 25 protein [Pleomassaria siparia CBS 279.74]|uniref:Glycosyltransferase family 25 protein n=1 Tax=Pleomassaria siparia CBS 279.74 TaxID=1314801 RepID=A0A6G1KNB1_9PLEO|nr:glycosyltransferase family 25 protein [Pleomassaria siparia CBS 279.74]
MPHRSDKRDFIALMALVSDLDIEFVDGVNGSLIHPRSLPAYWKGDALPGDYGCWRAHMNVYQMMLRERIQSALVMEDDADWDVLLKAQLTEVARGTRFLQDVKGATHSPYGDNWNVISLGHSGLNNKFTSDQKYWVTPNDPTVIAPRRQRWSRKPDLSAPALGGDFTRVVHEVSRMTGLGAYGISLKGAARVLFDQSIMPNAQSIDVAVSQLCRYDHWNQAFCLGAYPMVFGHYRAIGPVDKDSDRRATNYDADVAPPPVRQRLEPESTLLVYPASINIPRFLKNEHIIPALYPKWDMLPEIDLETFVFPKGRGVFVLSTEYAGREEMQHVQQVQEPQTETTEELQTDTTKKPQVDTTKEPQIGMTEEDAASAGAAHRQDRGGATYQGELPVDQNESE